MYSKVRKCARDLKKPRQVNLMLLESLGASVKETVLCRKADVLNFFFPQAIKRKIDSSDKRFWEYRKLLRGRRD